MVTPPRTRRERAFIAFAIVAQALIIAGFIVPVFFPELLI